MMPPPERIMDLNVVGVASVAWELFDFGMNKLPKTPYTDAVVRHLKAMQTPAGNWSTNEGRRPPMASGDFQAAALSIYSLKQYGQDADKASNDAVIAKAVKWLENAKPATTQDRAFHLLGLAWGNAAPATDQNRGARACGVAARRRRMEPVAGHGLGLVCDRAGAVCANVAGKMAVSSPVYQKGVDYLLRTQAPDGSWHVETRAIWLQPYFESGFPYGRDQFISAAGTAWAVMALAPARAVAALDYVAVDLLEPHCINRRQIRGYRLP